MLRSLAVLLVAGGLVVPTPAHPLPPETFQSVVSVLPEWPGRPPTGAGASRGVAPEGSGVVVAEAGVIATAWHVVEPAERIDVRLHDGRILPARLLGHDVASDLAFLAVEAELPVLARGPEPSLAAPVCAIGNAFGLGLSVTCGVVSRRQVSDAGFNAVEDFIQTDAAANPGSSGGALVDLDGRLVGLVSAIFASDADTNIGVNFAVSATLLDRVFDDLQDDGRVAYFEGGWRLAPLALDERQRFTGVRVVEVAPEGSAAAAGVLVGDRLVGIDGRPIRQPRDAVAALALVRPGGTASLQLFRDGASLALRMVHGDSTAPIATPRTGADVDPSCPHPAPVCAVRTGVFPVIGFDPLGSAVRIDADLLVASRHVVGALTEVNVMTPAGSVTAKVLASTYAGDLVLLRSADLPADGAVLRVPTPSAPMAEGGELYAVGADVARREVRVFDPGLHLGGPQADAPLDRLQVTAQMQPGVSGGALVDAAGVIRGIVAGGGEGRNEAMPLSAVTALIAGQDADDAPQVQARLGSALQRCEQALGGLRDLAPGTQIEPAMAAAVDQTCDAAANAGQHLEACRLLGTGGATTEAIDQCEAVIAQVPSSLNGRWSLLVALQLAGRFDEMRPHARWLADALPDDPGALRFAIQAGVWGGEPALAEAAYDLLQQADPRQAEAARRFIDAAPPTPPRR